MFPSLIQIGSKTAEKTLHKQTDRQTDKQTDTTKIMVTWPWTNTSTAYLLISLPLVELNETNWGVSLPASRYDLYEPSPFSITHADIEFYGPWICSASFDSV